MDNTNKLFDQIKTAEKAAENQDFPSMEKIWGRVEDKLDNKVLAKQNTFWKKTAIAASVLLAVFIGYHYFTAEEKASVPKKEALTTDTVTSIAPQNQQAVVAAPSGIQNPEAAAVVQKPAAPGQIVITNNYTINGQKGETTIISDSVVFRNNGNGSGRPSNGIYAPVFSARGVVYQAIEEKSPLPDPTKEAKDAAKKPDPLIVIDNKAAQKIDLDSDEIESMEVLTDPLYIINGSYYTEGQLFGPKPTSPYAPLSKLLIDTITILQNEKAIAIYGERGKKGVVIITTKSGKPEFK